jgi:hypothetical protein
VPAAADADLGYDAMTDNWANTVINVLPTVVPLATALFGAARGPGPIRDRLKQDTDVLEKLPHDSKARNAILELVDQEAQMLLLYRTARRDWSQLAVALPGSFLLWYVTVWVLRHGSWWVSPVAMAAGTLAIVLTAVVFASAQRTPWRAGPEAGGESGSAGCQSGEPMSPDGGASAVVGRANPNPSGAGQ